MSFSQIIITKPFVVPTVLADTTPVTVQMVGAALPATCWLHSLANTGRLIEVSTDSGVTYETVVYEKDALVGATYVKRTAFFSGVTHVRFTGAAGDTYGVC